MCGIVGIMSFGERPVHLEELHQMCAAIVHRGPDEDGFYATRNAGLGMRRLSIIDLKTGRQPISNEDGTVWVVFNGEIYNFQELRKDLEKHGHRFATTTDTEVIVHLYEQYGDDCVQKMRGMFAFAVWDERNTRLLVARDRLGIKPLYFGEVNGRLVFASELKAILQLPEVQRKLNWNSVSHLFTSLCTPPAESIIEGIHKLEPGNILVAAPRKPISVEPYWDVQFSPDRRRTEQDTIEELRRLINESVGLHLVSDVPVGAFLSGGIDSSAVVAAASNLVSGRLNTYSIGFPEEDFNELRFARMMAKRLGTEHHELVLEPNVLDILDDLPWYLDEPFGDSSAIPTYMVSKLAAQHGKVVLSGDGGDELFAGYDKYVIEKKERRYDRLPGAIHRLMGALERILPKNARGHNFLRHFSLTGADRLLDLVLYREEEKRMMFQEEAYRQFASYDPREPWIRYLLANANGTWLSAMQYIDLKRYLPIDILTKVDRMSMAHSLEVRPPLLDHKLVEFAATIPADMKLRDTTTKYIFKRALRGIVPDEIIDRPKRGFAIPLGRWFRGKLEEFVRDLLLSERTMQRGILRAEYIEELIKTHKRGRERDLHLWTLISFEMWCRAFLDHAAAPTLHSGSMTIASQPPAKPIPEGAAKSFATREIA